MSRYGEWESRELHHLKLLIFNTESHLVCSSHFLLIVLYPLSDTDDNEHNEKDNWYASCYQVGNWKRYVVITKNVGIAQLDPFLAEGDWVYWVIIVITIVNG